MALSLKQSYDEGFCKLMDELRKKYPEELFRIEGIHEDQTDINHTAWDFFRTTERKGSATADHSIDPNANVAGRDVITFNFEVPKPLMKLNSLFNMWKGVSALGGEEMAARVLEDEIRGAIYINDAHDMGRPYSYDPGTTIFIRRKGCPSTVECITMKALFDRHWGEVRKNGDSEEVLFVEGLFEVFEENQWVDLTRVLRHKSHCDTVRVETRKGNIFHVTEDHPCIMADGTEKKAHLLEKGDHIKSLPEQKGLFSDPLKYVTPKRAYIIGAMVGDGAVSRYGCMFCQKDALNSHFAPIFQEEFRSISGVEGGKRFTFGAKEDYPRLIELIGEDSLNRHLPFDFPLWTRDSLEYMLAGLIDTDGTVNKTSKNVSIRVISLGLVQQVCELAKIIGLSHVRTSLGASKAWANSKIKSKNPLYRVSFSIPEAHGIIPKSKKLRDLGDEVFAGKMKDGRWDSDSVHKVVKTEYKGRYVYDITTSTGRFYSNGNIVHNCFNYSTLDIALEGLPHVGRLTIKPPKSLSSFLHQVEQFVTTAANMTLGATGLADILIVASWYVDRILETGKDHKIVVGRENAISYVRELLTHFIYTVNYEFRGNQSPFTNVSLYDKHFREQLIPAYAIQGISPKDSTVDMVQKMYMDIFREELRREPLTFPVTTACFSTEEVDGERRIRDLDFLDAVSGYNLEQGFINYYMGDTSTLSSCCRLRSNVNDLGYANTFGAGSTKIGSLGVVTLNLPNIAFTVKGTERAKEAFFEILEDRVKDISYINQFKREFLRDRIRRGSLPLYTLGYMDLGHQYSTCGFTGLHEALEILGYDIRNEEGLSFAKEILGTINAVNDKMSAKWKAPHNMEQVPGETSSVKLARKDRIMGLNKDYELYSNQFIPLCLEGVDILDRIYLQGQLDPACTGGAICHLNVGEPIEDIGAMNAIAYQACSDGVVYFAVNYALNRCSSGHITAGRDAGSCPICGSEITDTFTRVVGFLTNTKHWNKTRREVDWPNRVFM